MLLVMAVIGTLTAVISGSLDTLLPKERLNTAVRHLTGALRNARSEAVSRSLEFYVEYDLDKHRFRQLTPFSKQGTRFIEEDMEEDERFAMKWNPLPPGVEFATVSITGHEFTNGTCFVRFDPRGAASDHQVVLSQPAYDNFYTIELLALTGSFKFHRGRFTREKPSDGDFN